MSLLVALPILTVFFGFFETTSDYFLLLKNTFLLKYISNSILLLVGVLLFSFLFGVGSAYCVSFYQVGINIIICCTCIYLCIFSDSIFWKLWNCFFNSNLFFWTIWVQFFHTKSWWLIWLSNINFFFIVRLCICFISCLFLLSITKLNRCR